MSSQTELRRREVLRAIVADYVSSQEPVGSKALVDRHNLGVSSATIRNDMAVLEAEGYITQPHTSSGRIPTEKGYREFVDRLSGVRALSAAEKRAIGTLLEQAVDLDDVMDRAVRLLAQLTQQVAVVQYPRLSRSALRHVELVPVAEHKVLVVLITDSGRVEQRTVELEVAADLALVAELRARINVLAAGRGARELTEALADLDETVPVDQVGLVRDIIGLVVETLREEGEERVVLAGTAHLARERTHDPRLVLSPVLEALEEQVVLLRLLQEAAADAPEGIAVRIGHETRVEPLSGLSVVATGYGESGDLARLGAIGPTRMDYPGTIAAVRAVALYLSRIVAG